MGPTKRIHFHLQQKERAMDKIDVYWNQKKPELALYVPHGRGLSDLDDVDDWNLDRTVYASEVSEDVVQRIDTDGHAFGVIHDE
jgi:hypothetical protein